MSLDGIEYCAAIGIRRISVRRDGRFRLGIHHDNQVSGHVACRRRLPRWRGLLPDGRRPEWIAQCLSDNVDAKVTAAVVATYCTCMNGKMSDNETRSITQWEKANPNARRACEREAGWN